MCERSDTRPPAKLSPTRLQSHGVSDKGLAAQAIDLLNLFGPVSCFLRSLVSSEMTLFIYSFVYLGCSIAQVDMCSVISACTR